MVTTDNENTVLTVRNMLKKEKMLLLVLTCTVLLLNGITNGQENSDAITDNHNLMAQSDEAQQLPENVRISSSVVTHISVESDVSEEYSESVEDIQHMSGNENKEESKEYSSLTSDGSQGSEILSNEETSMETKVASSQESKDQATTKLPETENPVGRRLPPVRAPVFLTNPPTSEQDDTLQIPTVVEHSISSDEMDVLTDQPQELDSEEVTTVQSSNIERVDSTTGLDLDKKKDISIISSVQTSRSMEEGEISYEEYNSEESQEENTSQSPISEEITTTTSLPLTTPKSRIIEVVVTSTSVIQEEVNGNKMELQFNTNKVNNVTTTTTNKLEMDVVTELSQVTNIIQPEITVSQVDSKSSPVMETTVTVPTETVNNNPTSIIYFNVTTTIKDNTKTTSTTSSPVTSTTSSDAVQTQVVLTNSNDTVTNISSTIQVTEKPIEKMVGKSLKNIFDFKNVLTEDPSVMAKMLPPMTTPSASDDKEKSSFKVKTITDKNGKSYTLKLLTEDPSVLAAMTPAPMQNNKVMKSIFDKTLGKNVTLKILTEDPSILAAMTPPPRPNNSTQSVNVTTKNETVPPPKRVLLAGVPIQNGKLPIITRTNATRKPFLKVRPSPRNPRPLPTFKKISDIVNRSRIVSTKRPSYLMKAVHEGEYQRDPDKTQQTVIVTTIRTTTTLSPIFRWGRYIAVSGNLKIMNGAEWSEDLRDSSSAKFKSLANEIEGQLDKIFRYSSLSGSQYKGVEVDTFSKGSVLVDYTLYLKEDTRGTIQEMIKTTYRNGLTNGTFLGAFKVDPLYANFRVVTPENILPPPSVEEGTVFPHWAIPIVGSGIAAFVFLIILCTIRKCSARAAKRKYGAPLTNDAVQENKKSVKGGYDNPAIEGFYDLDNVYNEKVQRRPIPYNNSNTSIYSNGSKSSQRDSKSKGKIQGFKRNDGDSPNETREIYSRDLFGKEPTTRDFYGREPIPKDFYGREPTMRESYGREPTVRESYGREPTVRESYGREPIPKQNKMTSNYDTWNEWEDFYDTRQQHNKYYEKDYDTTF